MTNKMVSATDLLHDCVRTRLGQDSLLFYGADDLPDLDRTLHHAKTLEGIEILETEIYGKSKSQWDLVFFYRDHRFLICNNDHGTSSLYFVDFIWCPMEVKLAVVRHFETIQ